MEATLEKEVKASSQKMGDVGEGKYVSFAEQYLETPVFKGTEDHELAKFTATACTYRGMPIWDDF